VPKDRRSGLHPCTDPLPALARVAVVVHHDIARRDALTPTTRRVSRTPRTMPRTDRDAQGISGTHGMIHGNVLPSFVMLGGHFR